MSTSDAVYVGDWDPDSGHARIHYRADGIDEPVEHVTRHSPDGLAWGYSGAGPADTALTILTHAAQRTGVGGDEVDELYQVFKRDHIAAVDLNRPFTLPAAIVDTWLAHHRTPTRTSGGHAPLGLGRAELAAWEQR